jgi:hypothetical protein
VCGGKVSRVVVVEHYRCCKSCRAKYEIDQVGSVWGSVEGSFIMAAVSCLLKT